MRQITFTTTQSAANRAPRRPRHSAECRRRHDAPVWRRVQARRRRSTRHSRTPRAGTKMLSRARGMVRARPMRPPGRTVGTRASRQSERKPPALLPASRAFAMARAKRGVTNTGAAIFRLVVVPELFLQAGKFNGTCPHSHTPTRRVRPRDDEQRRRVCVGGAWDKETRPPGGVCA